MRALAVKLNRRMDLPESAAWGVSPIETYLTERLTQADKARGG
jgi:hypothetical protein